MAELKRLNVNVPVYLIEQLDLLAERLCCNRTSIVVQACNQYIQNENFKLVLREIAEACSRLGTKGNNDSETLKELEDFMRLVKMVEK